ncbi:AraC family transcriptional regulator [Kaistia sp. 32K]|uniref:AraC family transcriptional regulator n=1 Tax=Kaistia sp. 32K TaxID=2795690 RepID=UPI0019150E3A|nr:AraC family transcriptional regulator [Kaistia sp. 32K]BCP54620.1 AraC family transcriptional regulator [Kaistia sp. 32K]
MRPHALLNLDIRSYGGVSAPHRHDFAQLVLPLRGTLAIDIAGREQQLDAFRAAFVETGLPHSQEGDRANRSLIVDLDLTQLAPEVADRLVARPFLPLAPMANRLIDYMSLVAGGDGAQDDQLEHWLPLLLDALVQTPARPQSRLAALLGQIEAAPGQPWTTERMAERIAMSVSRLHALFRSELDTTPAAWLSELRLRRAREWLANSDASIAELAFRAGYSDQNALTRAMRRTTGLTPAAYRRQSRATDRPE